MKRALLVGNDIYTYFDNLSGCANDVTALLPLLARHEDGSPNFDCVSERNVTREELNFAVEALLGPGAKSALLFFAGHGGSKPEDVVLCTSDGTRQMPGIPFSHVLSIIAHSPVEEIVVLLDCCFSGGAGGVPALASQTAVLRPGLTILAASRQDQPSAESAAGRGLFSTYVEGALAGGAADTLGRVDVGNLYAYVSESFGAWHQRPTFKANIERPLELRLCEPFLSLRNLREILSLFVLPFDEYPLDPSYEPTVDPRNVDHERIFSLLQRARASKLIEPVGEDHLYFAAINSTACALTPLGRHYHHVNGERLL